MDEKMPFVCGLNITNKKKQRQQQRQNTKHHRHQITAKTNLLRLGLSLSGSLRLSYLLLGLGGRLLGLLLLAELIGRLLLLLLLLLQLLLDAADGLVAVNGLGGTEGAGLGSAVVGSSSRCLSATGLQLQLLAGSRC